MLNRTIEKLQANNLHGKREFFNRLFTYTKIIQNIAFIKIIDVKIIW